MKPDNDIVSAVGGESNDENTSQNRPFQPDELGQGHINYEVLPIQELRKRAQHLNIAQWEELNKQKLIEEIRNSLKK